MNRPTCRCHEVEMVRNGGGRWRCAVKNQERCRVARQTPGTVAFEESHKPGEDGYVVCDPGRYRVEDFIEVLPLPEIYEAPIFGQGIPEGGWSEKQQNWLRWEKRFQLRWLGQLRRASADRRARKRAQLDVLEAELDRLLKEAGLAPGMKVVNLREASS